MDNLEFFRKSFREHPELLKPEVSDAVHRKSEKEDSCLRQTPEIWLY
jgi:hypothetical protein